jgi:hypothetical protein
MATDCLLIRNSLRACGVTAEGIGYFVNQGEEVREYDL